jgi:hypothetical protein
MISGILWIIYYSGNVIALNGELYIILFQLSELNVWTLTTIFMIVNPFGWLMIGFILLIVHGFKNNDSNMIYAGLVYFIGFVLTFIIPLFITS